MTSPARQEELVVRAPHLGLIWGDDGELILEIGASGRRLRVGPDVVSLLDRASKPATLAELAEHTAAAPSDLAALQSLGVLVPWRPDREPAVAATWSTPELLMQRARAAGRRRHPEGRGPRPATTKSYDGPAVPLTSRPGFGRAPYAEVLATRTSAVRFDPEPVSLEDLGTLLLESAAVRSIDTARGVSTRPYPSGGARHPLEIYVVPRRVEGLAGACYHFDPAGRRLVEIREAPAAAADAFAAEITECAGPLDASIGEPAFALMITGVFARTMWKYTRFGLGLVLTDAGCLLQTLYLSSAALGLAGRAVARVTESLCAELTGADPTVEGHLVSFLGGHGESGWSA